MYRHKIHRGAFKALLNFLAAEYAIYSPSGYPEPSSMEKLIENYRAAAQAIESFHWKPTAIICAGDKVVCRITVSGVFQRQLPDLPEGGKSFSFSLITILRVENGKIVEEWQEDDQLGFARQMGMELKPINGK